MFRHFLVPTRRAGARDLESESKVTTGAAVALNPTNVSGVFVFVYISSPRDVTLSPSRARSHTRKLLQELDGPAPFEPQRCRIQYRQVSKGRGLTPHPSRLLSEKDHHERPLESGLINFNYV